MKLEKEVICSSQLSRAGAEPGWCMGNTTIVRVGDRVFSTAMKDVPEMMPYNAYLLCLYEKKGEEPWKLVFCEEDVYQREPCPILYLGNNRLAITVNPTVKKYEAGEKNTFVPCTPLLYIFDITGEVKRTDMICLPWEVPGYMFYDHSYRSCARDVENGNLIFTNQYCDFTSKYVHGKGLYAEKDYLASHCYTVLDKNLRILRTGKLNSPMRVCYQTIGMRNGEVYILGITDEYEENEEYRNYKLEMTGVSWDYNMSGLFLFYSPDIEKEEIKPVSVVFDKRQTRGWVRSIDCCYDANGDMLFLVMEENVHFAFMRDRYFPEVPLDTVLKVCRFSHGELVEETIVDRYTEENEIKVTYGGFFHTAENNEIYLVWSKGNTTWEKPADHRKEEGLPPVKNAATYLSRVSALEQEPIKLFGISGIIFGNKTRQGAMPGDIIDIYSYREDEAIHYSRYELKEADF